MIVAEVAVEEPDPLEPPPGGFEIPHRQADVLETKDAHWSIMSQSGDQILPGMRIHANRVDLMG